MANHVFYLLRESAGECTIQELKGDKFPVGIYGDTLKPFTTNTLETKPGDLIYTFTDGYADQFGGPKGKKFKYKQLQEILLQSNDRTMEEQKLALINSMGEWQGDLEQVDDVCVIGVRL
jgi:serine phosphatase RsbU (regulator of sigma subunit)